MESLIPLEFIEWMRSLGAPFDNEDFFRALEGEPEVCVRLNRRKILPEKMSSDNQASGYALSISSVFDEEGIDFTPVPWCDTAFYLSKRPQFTLNPLLHGGAFYVQDASSTIYERLVSELLRRDDFPRPQGGLKVLDMCAAPGGKTTAVINALPDTATVVANEYVEKRARILEENLMKWGFPNVIVTNSDTAVIADCGALFDLVTVDAPCSGEGMMRKEEEARRQWSRGLVEQCAALQRDILRNAVRALKPGGFLIYSTCTFNPEENERNAEYITTGLGLKPIEILPEGVPETCRRVSAEVSDVPALRFMPHITRGEGLFVSIFRKDDAAGTDDDIPDYATLTEKRTKKSRNRNCNRKNNSKGNNPARSEDFTTLLTRDSTFIVSDLKNNDWKESVSEKGVVSLFSPEVEALSEMLGKVRILSCGVKAGEIKGKDLVADASLALSVALDGKRFPNVDLSHDDALKYLRRESVTLGADLPKGIVTVSYRGIKLGTAKHLGNRTNNLYPSYWRIRNL